MDKESCISGVMPNNNEPGIFDYIYNYETNSFLSKKGNDIETLNNSIFQPTKKEKILPKGKRLLSIDELEDFLAISNCFDTINCCCFSKKKTKLTDNSFVCK